MLMASVLGSATSPGLLHKSRSDASSSRSASHQNLSTGHTAPSPLGRSLNSVRFSGDPDQQDAEEELVWYSHKVLWSRGAEVFRTYSFQHEGEDVSRAAFVWFRIAGFDGQGEQSRGKIHTSAQKASDTFGFFRSSASTQWAAPRSSSALAQTAPTLQRTLVIFLQTRAHVYYSSGEDVIVNLPFPIDEVWALPQGGAVVQRALEKREVRRLSRGKATTSSNLLRGIDQTSLSILDDFVDLDDEDTPSLPRLYTLDSPFDELKMIVEGLVEGGFQGTPARLNSVALPPSSATTILHISQDPYPFVILHDQLRAEIIVSRRNHIPSSPQPPPPTARTMRPEDIFRQPEPPPPEPSQTLPSRPTLNRNPSSFVSSKERRISGAADPLDRTQRRAPRISRGNEHKPPSTGELQAALDPPPYVGAAMSAPIQVRGRVRGLSTASAVNGEPNRRTSGASSFMRQDMIDFLGKMALHVAGERDLRETTMMMGLEREEEGARSEMVLDRIWVWKPQR